MSTASPPARRGRDARKDPEADHQEVRRARASAVVEGNMAVIREGLEATQRVDYDAPEFALVETQVARHGSTHRRDFGGHVPRTTAARPVQGCSTRVLRGDDRRAVPRRHDRRGAGAARHRPVHAARQRGVEGQGPVPAQRARVPSPSTAPAAWNARWSAPTRRSRTRCTISTTCCSPAIRQLDIPEPQRDALREHVHALSATVRDSYRASKDTKALHEMRGRCRGRRRDGRQSALQRNLGRLVEVLAIYPVARTRPFFDAMEKEKPGSGRPVLAGHRSVEVQRLPGVRRRLRPRRAATARAGRDGAGDAAGALRVPEPARPNTPARFVDTARTKEGGDIKRLMLDRANYYATTGGHGACRGCGEVTAIRLVTSLNHAIHAKRRKEHMRELDALVGRLHAKRPTLHDDAERFERITRTIDDAGEAAVPAGKRAHRQRPRLGGHRQCDRLQQRLRLDVPVQPVQRSVGEQPVPGHAGGGQGHL